MPATASDQIPRPTVPRLSPVVHEALVEDEYLVSTGLRTGYLTLEDLDPSCKSHREGLEHILMDEAFRNQPLPRPWLRVLSSYRLWSNTSNPSILAYLTEELRAMDWTHPEWATIPPNVHLGLPYGNGLDLIHGCLPEPLYRTLLEKCRAHPHVSLLKTIQEHGLLPHHHAELQQLLATARIAEQKRREEQAAAEEAAREVARQEARKKSRQASSARRKGQEPLLLAIASGAPHLLARFKLEALEPDRLATVLEPWLAAPCAMRCQLIRVPGLPTSTQVTALDAWDSLPAEDRMDLPALPKALLFELKASTLTSVLEADLRAGCTVITPRLTPAEIDSLLLGPLLDDPGRAMAVQEGYSLASWLDEVRAAAPSCPVPYPDDPEATWLSTILERATQWGNQHARARLAQKLWPGWPPARHAALAPKFSELLQSVTLLPNPQTPD
jgi:hypothetical protein